MSPEKVKGPLIWLPPPPSLTAAQSSLQWFLMVPPPPGGPSGQLPHITPLALALLSAARSDVTTLEDTSQQIPGMAPG